MQVKPRGRGKIRVDKGIYDGYLHYCKMTKDMPDRYKISRGKYGKILKLIHEYISNEILENSETFKMPAGLPRVRIKKYKRNIKFKEDGSIDPKSMAIDWAKTREVWIKNEKLKKKKFLVYHTNNHTDGYSATFKLEKYSSNVPNLGPYRFKACRANERKLAKILKDPYNKIDYYL